MKKIKNIITIILIGLIFSCDTAENDVILPSEFNYISFNVSNVNVSEADSGPIKVKFIYSSQTLLVDDLIINYTLTYPANNAAQEGVDFILPSNSGSILLEAGQSFAEVTLIESLIDDDVSTGSRSVIFNLDSSGDFTLGKPGERENKSVEVIIGENDLFEFGYTSFEEVITFDVLTKYPRPAESSPLLNIQDSDPTADNPYVSYISTGNELGFTATFIADDGVSKVEDEVMGIYNNTVVSDNLDDFGANFIDGNQGYVGSDLDGTLKITFDEITGLNANVTEAVLEIKFFFRDTSWEETDGLAVYFETSDGLGTPLLSIFDDDAEDIEGVWQEMSIPIPADKLTTGKIVVTMFNGSGKELIMLDYISIKGNL